MESILLSLFKRYHGHPHSAQAVFCRPLRRRDQTRDSIFKGEQWHSAEAARLSNNGINLLWWVGRDWHLADIRGVATICPL
jgi:hypothetical protein